MTTRVQGRLRLCYAMPCAILQADLKCYGAALNPRARASACGEEQPLFPARFGIRGARGGGLVECDRDEHLRFPIVKEFFKFLESLRVIGLVVTSLTGIAREVKKVFAFAILQIFPLALAQRLLPGALKRPPCESPRLHR